MNEIVEAIVLGVVEGLTEFLPVSSTAHIRITQKLLNQDIESEYWKMFAVVIQLGAILAVVAYFLESTLEIRLQFSERRTRKPQLAQSSFVTCAHQLCGDSGSMLYYR